MWQPVRAGGPSLPARPGLRCPCLPAVPRVCGLALRDAAAIYGAPVCRSAICGRPGCCASFQRSRLRYPVPDAVCRPLCDLPGSATSLHGDGLWHAVYRQRSRLRLHGRRLRNAPATDDGPANDDGPRSGPVSQRNQWAARMRHRYPALPVRWPTSVPRGLMFVRDIQPAPQALFGCAILKAAEQGCFYSPYRRGGPLRRPPRRGLDLRARRPPRRPQTTMEV